MMQRRYFIIGFASLVINSCKIERRPIQHKLVGQWKSSDNGDLIEFGDDGFVHLPGGRVGEWRISNGNLLTDDRIVGPFSIEEDTLIIEEYSRLEILDNVNGWLVPRERISKLTYKRVP